MKFPDKNSAVLIVAGACVLIVVNMVIGVREPGAFYVIYLGVIALAGVVFAAWLMRSWRETLDWWKESLDSWRVAAEGRRAAMMVGVDAVNELSKHDPARARELLDALEAAANDDAARIFPLGSNGIGYNRARPKRNRAS